MRIRKKVFLSQALFFLIAGMFLCFSDSLGWGSFGVLCLFGFLNLMILFSIISPMQQMLDAIAPHKKGKQTRIDFGEKEPADEFRAIASAMNSLMDQVHEQKSTLTHQKEKTEEILESLREGIVAVDPSARVIFVNTAACQMLDVPKERLIGQVLKGGELLQKSHELIIHALQTAEVIKYSWVGKSQGVLYYDLLSMPLTQKDGALLVIQDRTSDYRILALGKEFIANASHELRTPITIIRGFAETLQDIPEISKEVWQGILQKILNTCARLDKLVHSLLTLADLEHVSQEKFTKVDLAALIERSVQALFLLHPHAVVRFHSSESEVHVVGSGDLLELALMNLLENAVKYSGGSAEIDIYLEKMEPEVWIKVQDRGVGIAEEDLFKIFERFYTVDKARSRKKGGAGLGLSIVKTIVEKHQGEVSVSSELGKGSVFTLVLPL